MGFADTVDSGRSSGGRSNFSRTCSLLSQYLKENGTFPDLKLGLTSTLEPIGAPPSGTANLLASVGNEIQRKSAAADSSQMTIFYAGQVIVFDDFPADKAKQIMMFASKSSGGSAAKHYQTGAVFDPPIAAQSSAQSTTGIPNIVATSRIQEQAPSSPQTALGSDLPIARKKSLARFLEKRKDRVTENAPYKASKPAAAEEGEEWLGIAPQVQW